MNDAIEPYGKSGIYDAAIKETRTISGEFNDEALLGIRKLLLDRQNGLSPLFIYAEPGLGKTHLLNFARTLMTKQDVDERTILYFDDRTFTQSFVDAMQNNSLSNFNSQFCWASMLLIDDVHCLDHKERTQEELRHILSEVNILKTPIIATGTHHPQTMGGFHISLRSKLCGGVAVKLNSPSVKSEIEFINTLVDDTNLVLTEEVKRWVSELFGGDFLQIKCAINRLKLFSQARCINVIDGPAFDKIYKGEFCE